MGLKLEIMSFCLCMLLMMNSVSFASSNSMLMDDRPPLFYDVGNRFTDCTFNEEGISLQLIIGVNVFDEDGIDTVIGSYKEESATIWSNITLTYDYSFNNGREHYTGNGPTFNLTPTSRYMVWNAVFYANDTLGNWNKSSQGNYIYNMFGPQTTSIPPTVAIIGTVISLTLVIIVIAIRRKKGT